MTTGELYQKLMYELDRSLLVDEQTYSYWVSQYQKLPLSAVTLFYDRLKQENDLMDTKIALGIEADPLLAAQITQKSKAVNGKILRYQEEENRQTEDPEEFLKHNLNLN